MDKKYLILLLVCFILMIKISNTQDIIKNDKYRYSRYIKKKPTDLNSQNHNNSFYKRRLDEYEGEFREFNIYVDKTNLLYGIENCKLKSYKDIIINSFDKAVYTIKKLLKVRYQELDFNLDDKMLKDLNIKKWDTEKFGDEISDKGINFYNMGFDLVIFGQIIYLNVSAVSNIDYFNLPTGQPVVGRISINRNIKIPSIHAQEFFDSLILHHITHILGFTLYHLSDFTNYITKDENDNKYYINSPNVIKFAKKYYNCSSIERIQLEDYGDAGGIGSHWESKLLLGEYMNEYYYQEELVISEFTLSLLEDTGYYKANYYTGGLMRFGKNKGCKFLNNKCVSNGTIDHDFENEFFDGTDSIYEIDSSCSSGRLSRTYNAKWHCDNNTYDNENNPNYFEKNICNFPPADFCPVPQYPPKNFIGHCSGRGSGDYGEEIKLKDSNFKLSKEIESITGEKYSDISFCYLSSLIKKEYKNNYNSDIVRATCYETFCSSKSLTVKINDDYIVCPRSGGKIKLESYDGFFLCPDYNLMCSGTVLCNNMFECVEKESKTKEESFIYEYKIKTTQNITTAKKEEEEREENYEKSEDGICPKYCTHCRENATIKECIKCIDGWERVEIDKNIICLSLTELKNGYFYNNKTSLYYKCIENCKQCSNETICEECKFGFINISNKNCSGEIKNCEEYNKDNNKTCEKCKQNFAFIENNRTNCINISHLNNYYSNDGGINYYPCSQIENCNQCNYNNNDKKLECNKCSNGYIILDKEKDKCYSKNDVNDENKKYYYINDTHAITCSKAITNCDTCEKEDICLKCKAGAFFLNELRHKCYYDYQIDKSRYYQSEDKTNYYSCRSLKYNNIPNCRTCRNSYQCLSCSNFYTFVNGNKNACINKHSLAEKYYQDPYDNTNYISCSNIDFNCIRCTPSGECTGCKFEYGIFYNRCYALKETYFGYIFRISLLAVELFTQLRLKIYILIDFILPDDFILYVPIIYTPNYMSNLQEIKKGELSFNICNYDKKTKIGTFCMEDNMEYDIEYFSEIKLDFKNIKDNKEHIINYTLNSENALYIDDYEKSELSNITEVQIYNVEEITKGKNFELKINGTIDIEKNITIEFADNEKENNIIEAECKLSNKNSNIIPCSLKENINSNKEKKYKMKDYISINGAEGKIISILMKNQNNNYLIIDPEDNDEDSSNKGSEKLYGGMISFIFIISLILLVLRLRFKI